MKYSVLNKTLDILRIQSRQAKLPEIIVCSSICDYLENNKQLKERLLTNLEDDLLFLVENNNSFAQLRAHLNEINALFSPSETNLFYKKLKEEAFVAKDLETDNQDILEILSSKLISKTESFDFFSKKAFTPAVTAWLTQDKKGLKVYCPFNNLLDVERDLSINNNVLLASNNQYSLLAKMIYLCCKGSKSVAVSSLLPNFLKEQKNKFDVAVSFPPLAMKLEKITDTLEINLIEDLLEKVSGRFCVVTILGISNSSVSRHVDFRENLLKTGKLQSIAELPGGFVPFSGVSWLAWFFDCSKNNSESITFIDLSRSECKDQRTSGRTQFEFNDYAIKNLINGLNHKEDDLVKNVSLTEIKENGYLLTPSRYVLSKKALEAKNTILQGDTRLSDVVEIMRTKVIRTLDEGDQYYEVSASDINPMGVVENPSKTILQKEKNVADKNLLKKDDIIFAIKGSVGKVGLVTEEHNNWLLNQSFVILRVKNKDWPVEFVFRQLKSNSMKVYLQGQTIGSVIPSLAVADLKNIPLVSPTKKLIDEQKNKHARQLELTVKLKEITNELEELNNF